MMGPLPSRWVGSVLRSERGTVAVLMAMLLPMLLGISALVVDSAHAFVGKRELQNAVDAAALAAASYLPSTNANVLTQARSAAVAVAAANGVSIAPSDVTFSARSAPFDVATVTAHATVKFHFAPRLGTAFGAIGSHGSAQIGSVIAVDGGLMPWGVTRPAGGWLFGQEYCLKLGANGGNQCATASPSNFQAIDIDRTGTDSASAYRDLIVTGSHHTASVGDIINIVTGNMVGPTGQGTGCTGSNGRISGDHDTFKDVVEQDGGSYRVLKPESPRLVVLPIVIFPDTHTAVITGFSVFFIDSCGTNGAVLGRFIDVITPASRWGDYQPGFGSRVLHLVD